jgi:hypothetical protein
LSQVVVVSKPASSSICSSSIRVFLVGVTDENAKTLLFHDSPFPAELDLRSCDCVPCCSSRKAKFSNAITPFGIRVGHPP